jgi:hypothetical protein
MSSFTCAQVGVLFLLALALVLNVLGAQPPLVVEADVHCNRNRNMTKVSRLGVLSIVKNVDQQHAGAM